MLNHIEEQIKALGCTIWELREETTKVWEFYFIRHKLDQNRITEVRTFPVTLYRPLEGDLLGAASGEIAPTDSDSAIQKKLADIYYQASLVNNPAYRLNDKQAAAPALKDVDVAAIAKDFITAMAKVHETETEFVNSYEIFVREITRHYRNSNGVEYTVEDTGGFGKYGVAFDVYYDSHDAALAHGHKTWEAYIADDNGTKEVEVMVASGSQQFSAVLKNNGLDYVAEQLLTKDEMDRYNLLVEMKGNKPELFEDDIYANSGAGWFDYTVAGDALSDQKFANMLAEAKKYLGYPYVWGGSSPSTSFDCSGFVCWVINHSGNGWNVGRTTANGLCNMLPKVKKSEAKPGDIIFFQGTYPTAGASHVGIYLGNGMMIHCGTPIQYASINTTYWQQHFYCFGRLPSK